MRLELSRSSFTRLLFLEAVNEMIFRSVDWKVKHAGFEEFHKRADLAYLGAFLGRRTFIKYFYELSERLLERGVYWIVDVYWSKYGIRIRSVLMTYFKPFFDSVRRWKGIFLVLVALTRKAWKE